MISEMAVEDLEDMREQGLDPTPADVVRLNAIGLMVERSSDCATLYTLPRVAYLGKLTFREPTIGHGIFIDAVLTFCDGDDLATRVAVDAFALSRQISALPDITDRDAVVKMIDSFTKNELAPFTFAQVRAAVEYAKHGADAVAKEYPPPEPGDDRELDDLASINVGVLFETAAMGLGLSIREIKELTASQAKALQLAGMASRGVNLAKSHRDKNVAKYMATKCQIVERLKKEREQHG